MLEHCSLFVGVEPEDIARMRDLSKPIFHREGDCIIRAGAAGDAVYVLEKGRVSIRMDESDVLAQHTEPGAFFGEIAIVDGGPRSASVFAETDSTVLKLPIKVLEECFRGNVTLEARVMRNLAVGIAAHLRRANTERTRS